ncbi:MAG TPA: hypothetical protein VF943_10960 [Burkholderiales bacterium]
MKPLQALVAALAATTALFASSANADGIDRDRASAPEFTYPYNSPYF